MSLLPLLRDDYSAPFFDAAARGVLLVRRCGACAHHLPPSAEICTFCGDADVDWVVAEPSGTLVTWAVPWARTSDGTPAPSHCVAVAELDCGPWLHGLLPDAATAVAGARVHVAFSAVDGGEPLPVLTVTSPSGGR